MNKLYGPFFILNHKLQVGLYINLRKTGESLRQTC